MENLLQVKRKLEDQMKIAYGNARLRLNIEEEKLEQLEKRKQSYEEELRFFFPKPTGLGLLRLLR